MFPVSLRERMASVTQKEIEKRALSEAAAGRSFERAAGGQASETRKAVMIHSLQSNPKCSWDH